MLAKATVMPGAGLPDEAARAACLAAFHAAQALIFERQGAVARTHRGVQASFNRLPHSPPLKTAAPRCRTPPSPPDPR